VAVQLFEDLASELHAAWMQSDRDERNFPTLAERALARFAPATAVTANTLFHWLIETDQLPRQFDPHSSFGNFSLTVATRDDFHIDVLVWTDSTTTIHQHGFSGAFHVLCGSSLHTLWTFEESRRWNDRLKHGQLAVRTTEWLKTGSTRPISPGAGMIHSLFHLESPSITVVVRTPSSATLSPPLNYERSGLAYDPYFDLRRADKVRQLLNLLWASDHPQRMALSEAALRGVDAHSATRIIFAMRTQITTEAQTRLIDILESTDVELAALLRTTVAGQRRDRLLVELRKQTRSPQHRLLLALVLNLPDRKSIDAALHQIAPDEAPDDWLFDAIRSMHDTPGQLNDRLNVLGFALNEASEQALRLMIRGYSLEQVSKTIAQDDDLVDDVRKLCSTLSAFPVLSPLLEQRLLPERAM